jgi:hypothetical protein
MTHCFPYFDKEIIHKLNTPMFDPNLLKDLSNNPLFGELLGTITKYLPTQPDTRPLSELIAKNYDGELDVDKLDAAIKKSMPNFGTPEKK